METTVCRVFGEFDCCRFWDVACFVFVPFRACFCSSSHCVWQVAGMDHFIPTQHAKLSSQPRPWYNFCLALVPELASNPTATRKSL